MTRTDNGRRPKAPALQNNQFRAWDEIIGTLTSIQNTDAEVVALLTCTTEHHTAITIQKNLSENQELENRLKEFLGKKIAILKTDNPQKPLVIRTIPEANEAKTKRMTNPQMRDISL